VIGTPHRRTAAAAAVVAGLAAACGASSDAAGEPAAGDPLRQGPQGNVAQFIVQCDPSHVAFDDPIVHPDQPGHSHLHQFFGNVDVGAEPDYESIIGSDTSCERRSDTASYWAPALLDEMGAVIEPTGFTAYYRPGPGVDTTTVEPYPAGLMMVAGDAMARADQPLDVVAWGCGTGSRREVAPPDCRIALDDGIESAIDSTLRLWVTFPDCWDGERLADGVDGSHVADSEAGACPATHPVPIPELQIAVDFPAVDPAELSLASGHVRTAHADFWNVWDQAALEREVRSCLNRDLVCGVSS